MVRLHTDRQCCISISCIWLKRSLKTQVPAMQCFFKILPQFLEPKQERTPIIFSSCCTYHVCDIGGKTGAVGMSCTGTCVSWKKSPAESWIFLCATRCFFSSRKSAYLRARHNPAYKHSWEMNACAGSVEWWHTSKSSCYRTHFVQHTFLWTKLQPVFATCQRSNLSRPGMSALRYF